LKKVPGKKANGKRERELRISGGEPVGFVFKDEEWREISF